MKTKKMLAVIAIVVITLCTHAGFAKGGDGPKNGNLNDGPKQSSQHHDGPKKIDGPKKVDGPKKTDGPRTMFGSSKTDGPRRLN